MGTGTGRCEFSTTVSMLDGEDDDNPLEPGVRYHNGTIFSDRPVDLKAHRDDEMFSLFTPSLVITVRIKM